MRQQKTDVRIRNMDVRWFGFHPQDNFQLTINPVVKVFSSLVIPTAENDFFRDGHRYL
jgi:hypothetical protein